MPWLLRDGEVLASLDVAESFGARLKGLLGRRGIEGALLVRGARSVHTFGMRFDIDVAHCDRDLVVVRTCTMRTNRLGRPVVRARSVLEAEAGAFARWELRPGDHLEIKE